MVNDSLVVKCKGVPFGCTEEDLKKFLGDSGIVVVDIPRRDGKATGDATVHFDNDRDFGEALKKDRQYMGHRYVEVFPASEERQRVKPPRDRDRDNREVRRGRFDGPPMRRGPRDDRFFNRDDNINPGNGEGVVRIRGLPFNSRERDVFDFFGNMPILPDGVLLCDPEAKRQGEAFVVFEDPRCMEAALAKHMQNMGHRYIEVFEASYEEMIRFCQDNRIRPPRPAERGGPGFGGPGGPVGPAGSGGGYGGAYGGAPPAEVRAPSSFEPVYPGVPDTRAGLGGYGYQESWARDNRAPHPDAYRPPPVDNYARPTPSDSYGRVPDEAYGRGVPPRGAYPPAAVDNYGRRAPESAPDRYGASPVDPYSRVMPAGPPVSADPYGRGPVAEPYGRQPAADPYGRPGGDPYSRAPDHWRDEPAAAPRNGPAPASAAYGDSGWDGYGYASDYGKSAAAVAPRGGGDGWRDEIGSAEAPRGRERPGQRYMLKMRGVPFRAVEADVYEFFEPIRPMRVEIIREPGGRPSGEARVEFESRKDYDGALLKDKQYMGSRYVELFPDFGRY